MIDKFFNGSYDEVEELVRAYFDSYPVYGYDTRKVSDYVGDDGIRHVHIKRYGNCD